MTHCQLLIRPDDLSGEEVARFLREHIAEMKAVTPPGSKHALDLDALRRPEVSFWTVYDQETLIGCGAMMTLDDSNVEIKSMRVAPSHRQHGVASALLEHILSEARNRGYCRASLETGSFQFFLPARRLYLAHGFRYSEPFGEYRLDPNSVYMTRDL